jgi:hypothetical protein
MEELFDTFSWQYSLHFPVTAKVKHYFIIGL